MSVFLTKITSIFITVLTFLGFSVIGQYDEPIDLTNGGDPFIIEDNGSTYYTYTTGGGVDIIKITSIDDTTPIERKTVFWSGENNTVGDIWAPEIHKIGNKWYIIATALFDRNVVPAGTMPEEKNDVTDNNDSYRYCFVLESETEDILSDYTFKGYLAPDGLNNIDGTYLKKDGKLYYIFSGYVGVAKQALYICEMENPFTLKADSNTVQISYPQYLWERKGWWVNEGPAVLYKDDATYILYSASGYSSGGYCLGMLTLKGDDILNEKSYSKSITPVQYHKPLKSIYNAGHCSFLYRENGDIYMVYHATKTLDFFESPRLTYIKKLEFNCNNRPEF